MMEWNAAIELGNYERLTLSDHETGLWLALWKLGAHCSSPITREQAIAIRENLDEWLSKDVEHASI
jgi:hypothetical protein